MNKTKHTEVKKTLVRNPEHASKTVTQSKVSAKSAIDSNASTTSTSKNSKTCLPKEKDGLKTRFNTPELHSTLKLSKKIEEVAQPIQTKSLEDVDRNKLAIDEKVSRKVNFPFSQPVFKDLIPLMNNEVKPQPVLPSRGPVLPRDKEPVLSDFLEPRKSKVYYHLPSCGARTFDESTFSVPAADGLKLYKILQINDEKY